MTHPMQPNMQHPTTCN